MHDRRRTATIIGLALVLVGAGVLTWSVIGRGQGGRRSGSALVPTATTSLPPGTTSPTTAAGLGVGFGPKVTGRTPLRGFGQVAATITSADGSTCEVCLLAAETRAQQERGLMEVTDRSLGGYDGMVFLYDPPVSGAFWMRNTPMSLSIAYFGGDGRLLSSFDMAPCDDVATCPSYPSGAAFGYALEVPKGRLDDVGVVGEPGEVTIVLTGRRCPLASGG